MGESKEYEEAVAYGRLPIYVYPEGDHWVATALGYDHVQRGKGPLLAADRLVRDLSKWGLIDPDKQKGTLHKLKGPEELAQIWTRGNK
jgi:hypothetical protein